MLLDKIDSTNSHAARLLQKEKLEEGTIILAQEQWAGRGQRGTTWEGAYKQNIAMSLVLYPNRLASQYQFYLNQCIALGVYAFVAEELGDKVTIKWPNDIYYEDKKVAGILIENTLLGNKISTAIVGIGININQTIFSESVEKATSFKEITGKNYDILTLSKKLCSFIEVQYLQFMADKLAQIRRNYFNVLYRFQSWHYYETVKGKLHAQIIDVTPQGLLVLLGDDSQQYQFNLKEVKFL